MQDVATISELQRHDIVNQLLTHVPPSPQVAAVHGLSFLLQVDVTNADLRGALISICRPFTDKPRMQPTKSLVET